MSSRDRFGGRGIQSPTSFVNRYTLLWIPRPAKCAGLGMTSVAQEWHGRGSG